jgi:hypothetical protein
MQHQQLCFFGGISVSKHFGAIQRATVAVQACVIALLVLASCTLHAQIAGTGQIQGTVTDSSGAVVANATVTLTNQGTHVQRVKQSDKTGNYLFPNIEVGTYDLSATGQGFETYVQTGIVLEVGSNIAVNPALTVGKQSEKVEVRAEGLALQTEDSSFKQTIDQQDVQEMPLNGRQMSALITLSGGSAPAPAGDFTGSKYSYQTISVSVAGGLEAGRRRQQRLHVERQPAPALPRRGESVQRGVDGAGPGERFALGRSGERGYALRNEQLSRDGV